MPGFFEQRVAFEPGQNFPGWTQQELQAVLSGLGISPRLVGASIFFTALVCLLCFWGIAMLLLWRTSNTWVGLLSAFILSGIGVGFSYFIIQAQSLPVLIQPIYNLNGALIWSTFFLTVYLFPDGHFIPHWTRFLAPLPYALFLAAKWTDTSVGSLWLSGVLIVFFLGGIASQIYRYRKVSNATQRQQTKWVVGALGAFIAFLILTQFFPYLIPALSSNTPARFFYDLVFNNYLSFFFAALIPLALGVSILRYHIWDIDVIIRRTLIYGILTVSLGLVFFSGVVLLQKAFGALTGTENSPVAIVLSTLAIAALFSPCRRRVQDFIDRRFYRRKYNAQKTLESFSVAVRNEVELEQLTTHLVTVVQETIQPEKVSLWMIPTQGKRTSNFGWRSGNGDKREVER